MPIILRKVRGKSCYSVRSKKGRKIRTHSKCTTLKKAIRQIRLLKMIDKKN